VPGEVDDDDTDPGKDQFQGLAMQSLGTSMTASGGIGIAKMISKQLHKAEDVVLRLKQRRPTPARIRTINGCNSPVFSIFNGRLKSFPGRADSISVEQEKSQ